MRRTLIAVVGITAVLSPVTSSASPGSTEWRPTPGGWASGAIEHVKTIPFDAGSAMDAVLHDDYLYTTSWRSFSIYDVSDPLSPALLSQTPTPAQLINEEPQTDGEILLLSNDNVGRTLDIYDVTNKAAPRKIGSYADTLRNHIWTCVFDCEYAYGATGTILDLGDPSNPVKVGDWTTTKRPAAFHSIEEVAPGMILTGSDPMLLLDGRADPANPTLVGEIAPKTTRPPKPYLIIGGAPTSLPARVAWPTETKSRYVLVSMETPFSGECADHSGTFQTFDSRRWKKRGFALVDEYGMTDNGTPNNGAAPVNFFGCTSYGLDVNPSYGRNGLVGTAWFEHGTRVLRIGSDGAISEVAGFVGHAGTAVRPVWRNEEVLYVIDFNRGIDVLSVG
jgi:LVIVD repeat